MIDFVAWLLVCVMDSVAVVGFRILLHSGVGVFGGSGGAKGIFGFGELTFVF